MMIIRGSSTGKIQSYTQATGKVYDVKTGKLIQDPNLEDMPVSKKLVLEEEKVVEETKE